MHRKCETNGSSSNVITKKGFSWSRRVIKRFQSMIHTKSCYAVNVVEFFLRTLNWRYALKQKQKKNNEEKTEKKNENKQQKCVLLIIEMKL